MQLILPILPSSSTSKTGCNCLQSRRPTQREAIALCQAYTRNDSAGLDYLSSQQQHSDDELIYGIRASRETELQKGATSTAVPDNEVPLREESHAYSLKGMFSESRSTKIVTSAIELSFDHATGRLQMENSHLYILHPMCQNIHLSGAG